jgi:hypothetical protein
MLLLFFVQTYDKKKRILYDDGNNLLNYFRAEWFVGRDDPCGHPFTVTPLRHAPNVMHRKSSAVYYRTAPASITAIINIADFNHDGVGREVIIL